MPGVSRKKKERKGGGVLEGEGRAGSCIVFLYERKRATSSRWVVSTLTGGGSLRGAERLGDVTVK